MDQQEEKKTVQILDDSATTNIPSIYANGFGIGISSTDSTVVLMLNNRAIMQLNMSHTAAKSVALSILDGISEFEKIHQITVKTVEELNNERDQEEG